MDRFSRRRFLEMSSAAGLGIALAAKGSKAQASAEAEYTPFKKALQLGHLPEKPDAERFKYAKEIGFDGLEIAPMADLDAAKRLGDAARAAGIAIHSIIYGGWGAPMSHPDPAVVDKGKKEIEAALRTAQAVGADAVLLVPGVVNDKVRYGEAWERSQANIRSLIPLAEELKIVIAVENVWNKFLLSPLEFAKYVDEFQSPWIRAYFDIGNVVIFGYPEDWIRTLGKRLVKIHVKDFKRTDSSGTSSPTKAMSTGPRCGRRCRKWAMPAGSPRNSPAATTPTCANSPGA